MPDIHYKSHMPIYIFPTVDQQDAQIEAMLFCIFPANCEYLNQLSFGIRATQL